MMGMEHVIFVFTSSSAPTHPSVECDGTIMLVVVARREVELQMNLREDVTIMENAPIIKTLY